MLAPAVDAIRARMAALFTAFPVRWPNESFPDPVTQGGLPVDGSFNPLPFVDAEVIGGSNAIRGVGEPGNRLFIHPGLIRAYVAVPAGGGTDDAYEKADMIAAAFERAEFGDVVRCGDASINAGVAGVEEGNYFVLQVSVPFDFFYHA